MNTRWPRAAPEWGRSQRSPECSYPSGGGAPLPRRLHRYCTHKTINFPTSRNAYSRRQKKNTHVGVLPACCQPLMPHPTGTSPCALYVASVVYPVLQACRKMVGHQGRALCCPDKARTLPQQPRTTCMKLHRKLVCGNNAVTAPMAYRRNPAANPCYGYKVHLGYS